MTKHSDILAYGSHSFFHTEMQRKRPKGMAVLHMGLPAFLLMPSHGILCAGGGEAQMRS